MNDMETTVGETSLGRISVAFKGVHGERPPKKNLIFDVILQNGSKTPLWFILPDRLTFPMKPLLGVVEAAEVYKLEGQGFAVVGHFCGSNGFHALLLPATSEITLRGFPVALWGTLPEALDFEAMTARDLFISGETAASWFEIEPLCSNRADVHASSLSEQKHVIAGRTAANNTEVPVTVINPNLMSFKISLS